MPANRSKFISDHIKVITVPKIKLHNHNRGQYQRTAQSHLHQASPSNQILTQNVNKKLNDLRNTNDTIKPLMYPKTT